MTNRSEIVKIMYLKEEQSKDIKQKKQVKENNKELDWL